MGIPNAGKSTLLNFMCGEKIAIVTHKPQTTRDRILAVKTSEKGQIIFLDTPGLHDSEKPLNKMMQRVASHAAKEADVIVMLSDPARGRTDYEIELVKNLGSLKKPILIAINKVDAVNKEKLLPLIDKWKKAGINEVFLVSALKGDGVDELENAVVSRLPEGPRLFPEEMITEHSERFLVSEIIREKVFLYCHQEIPYSAFVEIDEFKDRSESLSAVRATVYVEKESQKPIVIGHNGSMVKRIGTAARVEMEKRFQRKFYLELNVKTRKDWTKNETLLKRMEKARMR